MQKTIIFSDLDGTVLETTNHSLNDALPALNLVRARGIPLILCSRKTRTEIEACHLSMRNVHPFISENGGGIFIPQGCFSAPVEAATCEGHQLITLGLLYVEIITSELQGEARAAASLLAHTARLTQTGLKAGERRSLLFGGETTVTVRGKGKGGRNQALALTFALEIEGQPGVALLSAGTDGNDGPTNTRLRS